MFTRIRSMLAAPILLWLAIHSLPARALTLDAVEFAAGLSSPILVTNAPDGAERLFVVQQRGRVRILNPDGSILPQDFLNLSATGLNLVSTSGNERGLLGLAFHPDYVCNGRFFVHYTRRTDGASIVSEFNVSADPNLANTGETLVLGPVAQPESNHNGGMIAFGFDGMLYVAIGDGGGGGDEHGTIGNGQDTTTLLGKILRIDVDHPDGPNNYGIPADNPFFGMAGFREEIYAYGLRNPWRFSFDRLDGRLFCGDVGQGAVEEIDLIESGGNYGWRRMEGSQCYNPGSGCQTGDLLLPIAEYTHADTGGCSVTGGYVYRGAAFPSLNGLYLFADYCEGLIWSLEETSPGVWTRDLLLDAPFSISSFGEDISGEIYLCALSTGRIYRLIDSDPGPSGPVAAVSPAAFPLSEQTVGADPCRRYVVTIVNRGDADLTFTGAGIELIDAPPGEFRIINSPDTSSPLGPAERRVVVLEFDPPTHGPRTASLRITTNDPANPTIELALDGLGVPVELSRFELD